MKIFNFLNKLGNLLEDMASSGSFNFHCLSQWPNFHILMVKNNTKFHFPMWRVHLIAPLNNARYVFCVFFHLLYLIQCCSFSRDIISHFYKEVRVLKTIQWIQKLYLKETLEANLQCTVKTLIEYNTLLLNVLKKLPRYYLLWFSR